MKSDKQNKKIKNLKSVNTVLLKSFLLLTFLLILLVEVIFYFVVSGTSKAQARDRVVRVGKEVEAFAADNGDIALSGYIEKFRHEGINVYIVTDDGKVLLPLSSVSEEWSGEIDEIIHRLENAEEGSSVLFPKNSTLTYASGIRRHGNNYLVVTYSMSIFEGAMKLLLIYFILVGAAALLLTSLISYTISQKLSGGLRNLSATAVRFSKGDFNVDFANAEYQELADLSDTLNSVRDEVKKSTDFQREILANVSHDFKTPLTMIKAYASMIREISGDNPEKRDKHLQVIIDEADRLTGLVNDVLNVSKVSSKLDELNLKVFNLTDFLYGIINKFEYLQETKGFNFMVDIDANLYTRADEEKIGQVIYNLLGNAINYTGEDKTVFISLKHCVADDRIRFSVRDTGKGISKEDLPEIWNRYYRVKENHSRPVKGTGLGLNIVKVVLQAHSFDFGADSELGNGSTFWVDFPSVPAEIEVK